MYLQQHHQQAQQQWALDQQQSQQLEAQHHQQIQMQRQNFAQSNHFGNQSSRKRGFESDESSSFKKRNLGSDVPNAQGFYSDAFPDSPGSIRSNMSADLGAYQGGGYFDQSHFSASSSTGTSPHGMHYLGSTGLSGGASAPSTPAGIHIASSSSLSSSSSLMPSSLPHSWNSFAYGSHSSPPTPHISAMPNSTEPNGMTATMTTTNLFASTLAEREPLEYHMLQEQKKLHETQMQEQQRLQMAQQQELHEMQRHQEEQSRAAALAKQNSTHVHDRNDPATWDYDGTSSGRFTGYLGGNGKGYTPAAIGGVAALAAMAAANRETYGGRNLGMDMDL
ncbi:hypothetical protein BGX26_010239 [Mortierella sp. AD094]|nr:hypothetical protein BGX26_010239 [Mortierella sp. AD094]